MKIRITLVMFVICAVAFATAEDNTSRVAGISSEFVNSTVASLESLIERQYFDPAFVPKINAVLEAARTAGKFNTARDLPQFLVLLNDALYEGSHDKHLFVSRTALATPEQGAFSRSEQSRLSNYGIARAEVLDGNIGYLRITFFYRSSEGATDILSDAMKFLSHRDALILDLRDNKGGSPDTAVQLLSYFLGEPDRPLFSMVERSGNVVIYRTSGMAAELRDEKRPLYVLVSNQTWSAGEGVAFFLQEHHRATIIGERTPGAANPAGPWTLNEDLTVTIPFGRIKSAVLDKNWEGSGVLPDVSASAENALKIAYVDALEKLLQGANAPAKRKFVTDALAKAKNSSCASN